LEERIDQTDNQKYTATNGDGFPMSVFFDMASKDVIKIQKEHYIIYVIYYDVVRGIHILEAKIIFWGTLDYLSQQLV